MHVTRGAVLAVCVGLAACSRGGHPVERLAILPFENLTGDASLNWVATAAPLVVAADLSGAPKVFAQPMLSRSDAYLANSTRFVQGYFTGHAGSLRFQVEVEDASRHKMVADEAASGDLLASMNTLAKGLDSSAHSFSTSNTEAMAAWGHRDYEKAVTLDPDFGAAWFAWAEALVTRGESAQAADVAGRALKRPGLQSNVDRARLELLSATLRHDADARAKALTSLARLLRTDTPLLEALASAEMNARRFSTAVELFSNIVNVDPENAGDRNLLGYAQVYAGDFNAAAKTFEEYGKMPDQKTNSLDSLGEACFLTGRFKDAEKYFLQAYDSNHAFLAGTDLFKAAYAHWLGGDLKGADELMKRYLDTRRNDPLRAWREASWDYATGRRDQAVATLRKSPDAQIVDRQMAVWGQNPPQDVDALKQLYEHTPPASDGQARSFYAASLVAAGQRDEARKLLALWPLPTESGGDLMRESMVFPKFIEARRAVGLPVP